MVVLDRPARQDIDCLLNWAEATIANILFPANQPTKYDGNATYRQYASGIFLGIDNLGNVLAQGGPVGPNIATLGHLQDFLPTASAATCGGPAPAPDSVEASESIIVTPPWNLVTQDSQGNHNTETVFELAGVSDDGKKVGFFSWSKNTFGTGAVAPGSASGYVYVRDVIAGKTEIGANSLEGAPLGLYEPRAWISGNGEFVVFRSTGLKRFKTSTVSTNGVWRAKIGTAGYELINIKGLEFGFENNGTLKVGETILGAFSWPVPDRDGNSIVFIGNKILNDSRAPYDQYNTTAYFNAVLRLDKGAQPIGNQDYTISHSMLDTTLDVDPGGTYVVLGEKKDSKRTYVLWDMLARNGLGGMFSDVIQQDGNASFTVCGVSAGAARLLVRVSTTQPMYLSDMPGPLLSTKYGHSKLLVYDRATNAFQMAAAAERSAASTNADCDYPFEGGLQRQLSSDGNIIAWRDSQRGFYVRNLATQKTVLVSIPSNVSIGRFTLSGDGRHIVYSGNGAPNGQSYLNSYGNKAWQVFHIGPIDTSVGRRFTATDYWTKFLN